MKSPSFIRLALGLPAVLVVALVLAFSALPAAGASALPAAGASALPASAVTPPVKLVLHNGWKNVKVYGSAAVAVDGNGVAHLSGDIYGGSSDSLAFFLPAGDEPASNIYINLQGSTVGDDDYLFIGQGGNVDVVGSDVTSATFLSGISFQVASSPLGFADLTLKHSWVSENPVFGTGDPEVAVDSQGIVHLSGSMAGGASDSVAFMLPAGSHPPADTYVNTYTDGGTTGSLEIETNGDVIPFGSDVSAYTNLSGISFRSARSTVTAKTLTLENGWTGGAYVTGVPTVSLDQYGFVHLAGGLTNTSDNGDVVTLLPKGDRPSHFLAETIYTFDGAIATVEIYPSGDVFLVDAGTGTSAEFSSLGSVTFEAGV